MINGNETVELDFGSLHPTILYNKYLGEDVQGDLYEGFEDRAKTKYTLLTLLNCMETCNIKYPKSIEATRKKLIDEGFRSEDGLTDDHLLQLIRYIEEKHPKLKQWFGTQVSLELMRTDSDIAMDVLMNLIDKGIFAIPVHDSFIVEKQYQQELYDQMALSYQKFIGFTPRIDEK